MIYVFSTYISVLIIKGTYSGYSVHSERPVWPPQHLVAVVVCVQVPVVI